MPIITVQRRHAEHGRIRLGYKQAFTKRNGEAGERPAKLDRFRFTSASQRQIEEIAAKYGGTAEQWDNAGKAEWQVISDATSIPVIVVKGGFTQWHEHWTRAGLQHRCDGEKDVTGEPCDPQDPSHLEAIKKPTTRLSVMLSEIESLGLWRMESKGWNAAAELPNMAELAMHVGDLVPATLSLAERSSVIETDKGPQTSRFVVPVLDLHVTKQRLVELVSGEGGMNVLEAPAAGGRPALEAGGTGSAGAAGGAPVEDPYTKPLELITEAQDHERLVWIWDRAREVGIVGEQSEASDRREEFIAAWKRRAHEIQDGKPPAAPASSDGGDVVDAELVDDADEIWERVVRAGGDRGMTLPDLEIDFAQQMGGLSAADASAAELTAYLEKLEAVPAA